MAAIVFPTDPDRLNYVSAPWTDAQGKQWTYEVAKNRWNPYASSAAPAGGASAYGDLTDATSVDLPTVNTPLASALSAKQATLVSGTNIKTVNGTSLLGSGNITISGGDLTSGPVTSTGGVSAIADGALSIAKTSGLQTALTAASDHAANTSNPHSVTKTQVGLGSVENTALSTWAGSANITTLGSIATGTWQGSIIAPAYLGTGTSISTKFLRGDGTWQTIGGGGDALVANNLDQFADVTQTAGQTLAITASTTLAGGTHSGTNTGDVTVTGNGISLTGQQLSLSIGTGSTQVAAGNHTHSELHAALTLAATLTDVFSLSTQALGAVDATDDKIPIWDDLAAKLTYATLGTGLSYSSATLSVDADATATNNTIVKRDGSGAIAATGYTGTWNGDSVSIAKGGTGSTTAADARTALKVPASDTTGITGADAVSNIVTLTQAEYDAIGSPSASTLYVIV
jgi:hypothetical protein